MPQVRTVRRRPVRVVRTAAARRACQHRAAPAPPRSAPRRCRHTGLADHWRVAAGTAGTADAVAELEGWAYERCACLWRRVGGPSEEREKRSNAPRRAAWCLARGRDPYFLRCLARGRGPYFLRSAPDEVPRFQSSTGAAQNEPTYERLTTSPTNRIFDALVAAPTRPAASPNPYSTDTPPAAQQLSSHSRSPQRGRPALRWRWSTVHTIATRAGTGYDTGRTRLL